MPPPSAAGGGCACYATDHPRIARPDISSGRRPPRPRIPFVPDPKDGDSAPGCEPFLNLSGSAGTRIPPEIAPATVDNTAKRHSNCPLSAGGHGDAAISPSLPAVVTSLSLRLRPRCLYRGPRMAARGKTASLHHADLHRGGWLLSSVKWTAGTPVGRRGTRGGAAT